VLLVVGIGLVCPQAEDKEVEDCLGHLPKASNCSVRCPCQEHSN
jgi:hypothetical protein